MTPNDMVASDTARAQLDLSLPTPMPMPAPTPAPVPMPTPASAIPMSPRLRSDTGESVPLRRRLLSWFCSGGCAGRSYGPL